MPKRKTKKLKNYVPHPKYGVEPIKSSYSVDEAEVKNSFWRYQSQSLISGTAIPADTGRQNYTVFPRPYYVDIERQCLACDRWFLFFAQEQKYWYETLGFFIDADCTHCIECRKQDQEIKNMHQKYQELLILENRKDKETQELKKIAQELFDLGFIKNIEKVNAIK